MGDVPEEKFKPTTVVSSDVLDADVPFSHAFGELLRLCVRRQGKRVRMDGSCRAIKNFSDFFKGVSCFKISK